MRGARTAAKDDDDVRPHGGEPTPKDDTDRRIAALTEHFEAGRTVSRRAATGGVRERRRAAAAHHAADEDARWFYRMRVLETRDAVARVFRCNQEGADAVAASMEMS